MTIINHPLQSKEWAEFRKAWGNEVLETEYGYLTLHKLPFTPYKIGMFIKCPPPTSKMLSDLKKLSVEKNIVFIKLEPSTPVRVDGKIVLKDLSDIEKILSKNGAAKGKTLFTPSTFWIDLTKSEEDLLKSFHPKTRYNIRLAEKKGVSVIEDNSDKAFEKYLKLMKETVERQGFYAHSEKYHRLMWKYLGPQATSRTKRLEEPERSRKPIAHLLTASCENEVLTAWVVFAYKDFLYYPYGASTDKHKDLQSNSLMMWEAIKFGKRLSLKTFDLWGREEGKGFTKFKEGFSPSVVEFLGTWDLVINKRIYKTYLIAEKIRWYLLRLRTKVGLIKPTF